MPADVALVHSALLARLANDAPLTALLPDGVYIDAARQSAQKFVRVSVLDGALEGVFGGRAVYSGLYLVEAVTLGASSDTAVQAASRFDSILEDQPLSASGWNGMSLFKETELVIGEVDAVDPSIRWQRRGGHYRVEMSVVGK
jgi:hypothetical protein